MVSINDNKVTVKELLTSTGREGMSELLEWLDNTDYYTAPASSYYHSNFEGGLVQHSLKVYRLFKESCERHKLDLSEESVIIIALLHDLCKVNFYVRGSKNKKDDSTGSWHKIPTWSISEQFPYGHGEKSVDILRDYIKLTEEEKLCIRWHMGAYEGESKWNDVSRAYSKYKSVVLFHTCDIQASYMYEKTLTDDDLLQLAISGKKLR